MFEALGKENWGNKRQKRRLSDCDASVLKLQRDSQGPVSVKHWRNVDLHPQNHT